MLNTSDDDLRRLEELDRQHRTGNIATAILAAVASLFFFESFGWGIVIASWLPITSAAFGFGFLRRHMTLLNWYVVHLTAVSASVLGSVAITSGAGGPLFQMIPLIGLIWLVYLPGRAVSFAITPTMALVVVLTTWPPGDAQQLAAVSTLIVSMMIPWVAHSLVQAELVHRQRSVIDALTGCLNRRALDARVVELQLQLDLNGESIGVVTFDIDHFKRINDTYGHAEGDRVLRELSAAVRKGLRRFELFYRFGGEEFVVLLAGASESESMRIAGSIRESVTTVPLEGQRLTVSCGVAVAGPDTTLADALKMADEAMYQAKDQGRDRSILANSTRSSAGRAATTAASA